MENYFMYKLYHTLDILYIVFRIMYSFCAILHFGISSKCIKIRSLLGRIASWTKYSYINGSCFCK